MDANSRIQGERDNFASQISRPTLYSKNKIKIELNFKKKIQIRIYNKIIFGKIDIFSLLEIAKHSTLFSFPVAWLMSIHSNNAHEKISKPGVLE